jgi:prepilin-type N-terminal cleavage/methylation domain-containing protein
MMWWWIGSPAASLPAQAPARRSDRDHAAGFTLIEVLVAFAIAAMLLVVLLQLFATGLRGSGRATREIEATLLAESSLEQFGRTEPLLDGMSQRSRVGRYSVQIGAQRRDDLVTPGSLSVLIAPYDIDVSVSWLEGQRRRVVTLQTIRLGVGR